MTSKQASFILGLIVTNGFKSKLKRRAQLINDRAVDMSQDDAYRWLLKNVDVPIASKIIQEMERGDVNKAWEELKKLGLPIEN